MRVTEEEIPFRFIRQPSFLTESGAREQARHLKKDETRTSVHSLWTTDLLLRPLGCHKAVLAIAILALHWTVETASSGCLLPLQEARVRSATE